MIDQSTSDNDSVSKCNGRFMNKKNYHAMLKRLEDLNVPTDVIDDFALNVQEIFAFDPNRVVKRYNEKNLEAVRRYRERLKAEGVSTYISSGKKSSYDKKKTKTV